MEKIILNPNNLTSSEIEVVKSKIRALIINSESEVIITEYNFAYMFPGGKRELNENEVDTLKRELKEELGISFDINEIKPFVKLYHYNKDYVTTENEHYNRLTITDYYLIKTDKKLNLDKGSLSDREKEFGFKAYFSKIDEIYSKLNGLKSENPRAKFFSEEINIILNEFEKIK